MNGCYKFNLDVTCTRNQTRYGCRQFGAFPAIRQAQIGNSESSSDLNAVRVCAKLGGETFLNAVRPDLQNKCPDGYEACSKATHAESTICFKSGESKLEQCPITDVRFVD